MPMHNYKAVDAIKSAIETELPFKYLLPDLISVLCSMQGTLPAGTMMQYSSNVETPLSPPVSMPAVEPRPMQLQHGFLAHGWVCT